MIVDRADLLKWLEELFEEPVGNITSDTRREDIPGWDSLGVLVLMANLDERFGIVLSEDKISNLHTINDILLVIENR